MEAQKIFETTVSDGVEEEEEDNDGIWKKKEPKKRFTIDKPD